MSEGGGRRVSMYGPMRASDGTVVSAREVSLVVICDARGRLCGDADSSESLARIILAQKYLPRERNSEKAGVVTPGRGKSMETIPCPPPPVSIHHHPPSLQSCRPTHA